MTQWWIVRESPGQLQTGEGAQPSSVPVTVLKRQRAARHEMAPMAEVLTHWARTAGRCPRQGICERWLHKERGVVELCSFLFSIYRYTTFTAHAPRSVGHWGRLSFSAHQRVEAPTPSAQVGVDGAKERAVVHVLLPPHRNHVTVSS